MSFNQRIKHECKIEIDPKLIGLVLGKGKSNLLNLKNKYNTVNIKFYNSNGFIIFDLSANIYQNLNACERDLRNIISKAEYIQKNISEKKKLNKEKNRRIKSNLATKKLREQITNELLEKKRIEESINNTSRNNFDNKKNFENEEYIENQNNNLNNINQANNNLNNMTGTGDNNEDDENNNSIKLDIQKKKLEILDNKIIEDKLLFNKFASLDIF